METTEKKSLLLWTLTNMKDMQYVKSTMAGAKPIRPQSLKMEVKTVAEIC